MSINAISNELSQIQFGNSSPRITRINRVDSESNQDKSIPNEIKNKLNPTNFSYNKGIFSDLSAEDKKSIKAYGETLASELKAGSFDPKALAEAAPEAIKNLANIKNINLETQLTNLKKTFRENPIKNSNYVSPQLLLQQEGSQNSVDLLI